MTNTTHSLRLAGSTLAVALALVSTQSLAQDATAPLAPAPEPVIVVPDVPAPVTPEPVMVQPVEQPEPAPPPEATVETPKPAQAPATALAPRTRAPAARTASEPAARVEPAAAPADTTAATLPPVAVPAIAEPAPPIAANEPAPANNRATAAMIVLALAGLAILVLAIWGFIAIGRRKPLRRVVAESTAPSPAPLGPTRPLAEPVAVQPVHPVESLFAQRQPGAAGSLPHAGAAVALPRELPASYEEREALFLRMVEARPDRANPFTDRKSRMKRARLIMQSIGRDFGDAEPWIDLSQYPNNWPEQAHRRSAAA